MGPSLSRGFVTVYLRLMHYVLCVFTEKHCRRPRRVLFLALGGVSPKALRTTVWLALKPIYNACVPSYSSHPHTFLCSSSTVFTYRRLHRQPVARRCLPHSRLYPQGSAAAHDDGWCGLRNVISQSNIWRPTSCDASSSGV